MLRRFLLVLLVIAAAVAAIIAGFAVGAARAAPPPGSWVISFDDEFNAALNATVWTPDFPWGGDSPGYCPGSNPNVVVYRPSQAATVNGALLLTARNTGTGQLNWQGCRTNSFGEPLKWVSALRQTGGNVPVNSVTQGAVPRRPVEFAQTYGYFEARMRLPAGQGFWPAFWSWAAVCPTRLIPGTSAGRKECVSGQNATTYDYSSEMDFVEVLGRLPDTAFFTLHSSKLSGGQFGCSVNTGVALMGGGYHVYGMDWEPGFVRFYFDGRNVCTYVGTAFNNASPHFVILNFAVGGAHSWPGATNSSTPATTSVAVDWVHAWSH